ncbi:MAG: hypothetical protein N3A01_00195 [Bacteroidales bacterium]|nr:hypothetical protein [Bacteroidales bacterium]
MRIFFHTIITLLVLLFTFCKKENKYLDTDVKLSFSVDTLLFDTVFSTIGSATYYFTVYNKTNRPVKISKIRIGKGSQSYFKINIDGISATEINDYELDANDSFFVFVQVKIDPTNSNNPILVHDSIEFHTKNKIYDVDLIAYGQDVHLIKGEIFYTNTTFVPDKPYLIYNSMLVDTNATLTIEAGTKLYFHKGSKLYVKGTLKVNGTLENPVIFRHDRLEDWYNKIPGQWGGIHLLAGSRNNVINYADIKNAIIGIQADSFVTQEPCLTISNTRFFNMAIGAIYALGSSIKGWNLIIGNCGYFAIGLFIGGYYEFYHCTVYNCWYQSVRQTPSIILNNYYKDINNVYQIRPLQNALFANCILYGNIQQEILLDSFPNMNYFNYQFKNCLIKVPENFNTNNFHWENIYKNYAPSLKDPANENFELTQNSFCINKGNYNIAVSYALDYKQYNRLTDGMPDLGAFEYH